MQQNLEQTEGAVSQAPCVSDTVPEAVAEQTVPADTEGQAPAGPADGSLTVRFNHQDRVVSREEAVRLAQQGLKYQSLEPTLVQLRRAAAISGRSASQLLSEWSSRAEAMCFADAVRRCGGNEQAARQLMESERDAVQRRHGDSLTERLANGFVQLQRAVPQVTDIKQVPSEVWRDAVEQDIPLLDAFLRHRNREQQRIDAAAAASGKASADTVGALSGGAPSNISPEIHAMLAGVRR